MAELPVLRRHGETFASKTGAVGPAGILVDPTQTVGGTRLGSTLQAAALLGLAIAAGVYTHARMRREVEEHRNRDKNHFW